MNDRIQVTFRKNDNSKIESLMKKFDTNTPVQAVCNLIDLYIDNGLQLNDSEIKKIKAQGVAEIFEPLANTLVFMLEGAGLKVDFETMKEVITAVGTNTHSNATAALALSLAQQVRIMQEQPNLVVKQLAELSDKADQLVANIGATAGLVKETAEKSDQILANIGAVAGLVKNR